MVEYSDINMTDSKMTGEVTHLSDAANDQEKDQGKATDSSQYNIPEMIAEYQKEYTKAKESAESWLEHCKKLVIGYREILQAGRSNYYKKDGEVGYIISMNWLENWK